MALRSLPAPALLGLSLAAAAGCVMDDPAADAPAVGQVTQADTVCAPGPTVYGIDVSRFQGSINWQPVADSGVKFAYIQISRSLTDIDAKFAFNWQRAKEVGILRGAYQRFQPDEDVLGQANLFLDRLGPYQEGDLPPMLDVEDDGGLGAGAIADAVRQWLTHVEGQLGVHPIIYTGRYFWQDQVGGADFTDYPLWIANYGVDCPNIPAPWTEWAIHQYASTAVIPGISENTVDVNNFNGTIEQLRALGHGAAECGDGECTGGETSDSCAADCPPCEIIGADGGVVDDTGPCFTAGGPQDSIREENAGYGSFLKWTHTTSDPDPVNYGLWDLHFEEGGRYRAEAFTPAPFGQSRQAVYQVTHGGQTEAIEIDQTAVDGWATLGDFEFAAGGGQSIRVDDNTGEPLDGNIKLVFDAVRFTRLGGTSGGDGDDQGDTGGDDEGDGPDNRDMTSGCAAAGGGSGAALALLAGALVIGLARRRRRGTLA